MSQCTYHNTSKHNLIAKRKFQGQLNSVEFIIVRIIIVEARVINVEFIIVEKALLAS